MTQTSSTAATAADGTRLSVIDVGDGEPVLFIPGLGYAAWSFIRQLGPISTAARVLAMDNRGSGHSDKPAGPYSIAQMADDAFAVLSQFSDVPARIINAVNSATAALNCTIQKAVADAQAAGLNIVYVDVTEEFAGHGIGGSGVPFINAPGTGIGAFHPTSAGYVAYAEAISAALPSAWLDDNKQVA